VNNSYGANTPSVLLMIRYGQKPQPATLTHRRDIPHFCPTVPYRFWPESALRSGMDRPNLTILSEALVTPSDLRRKASHWSGNLSRRNTEQIRADLEVILSLGAINTPSANALRNWRAGGVAPSRHSCGAASCRCRTKLSGPSSLRLPVVACLVPETAPSRPYRSVSSARVGTLNRNVD